MSSLYLLTPPAPSVVIMSKKVAGADSDEEEQDVLQFKLVILGDGAVGKTSLSMRFSEDRFAKR